jgi:hypothetical protein
LTGFHMNQGLCWSGIYLIACDPVKRICGWDG